jgi:hypothetical protein
MGISSPITCRQYRSSTEAIHRVLLLQCCIVPQLVHLQVSCRRTACAWIGGIGHAIGAQIYNRLYCTVLLLGACSACSTAAGCLYCWQYCCKPAPAQAAACPCGLSAAPLCCV